MSKVFKQFFNPHAHSHHSIDGAATVEDIIKKNIELGCNYVALTEHGNFNSSIELYSLAKKYNAYPILGVEVYLIPPYIDFIKNEYLQVNEIKKLTDAKIQQKLKNYYVHLVIHFKDEIAYKYFSELTLNWEKRAIIKFGERKPLCTWEDLLPIKDHITIGTACIGGILSKLILPDRFTEKVYFNKAEETLQLLINTFGKDNIFIEIMPHILTHKWINFDQSQIKVKNLNNGQFIPIEPTKYFPDGDIQKYVNKYLYLLGKKYNVQTFISLDSHFATKEQKFIQDIKLANEIVPMKYYTSYHIYSTNEVADTLKQTLNLSDNDIEIMVNNSLNYAKRFENFKLTTNEDRWVLVPLNKNWKVELLEKIKKTNRMDWSNPQMVERLKYEISVLCDNKIINLIPYLEVVEDIANFCKQNNILINVRGSSAGVLLLYLLGISAVNPLKHNLSFERFITVGRIKAKTLPDIDIDVSDQARVFKYLEEKYQDKFLRISVDLLLKLKSSIKDVERGLYGKVSKETEIFCKTLPNIPQGTTSREWLFGYTDDDGMYIQGALELNENIQKWAIDHREIWDKAVMMLDLIRQKSVHACGCIIADKPIYTYTPVVTISNTIATGLSPKSLEYLGLVKYDILGVNTLTDIQNCLLSIKNRFNKNIDIWNLPEDPKVFKAFHEGRTETIFQFNTHTVIPYLKKIKPNNIEDLAAITALCRPGTLDAPFDDGRTLADVFTARKMGLEKTTYIHPDLEHILKNTMGIQLYQEQTLQIFRDIAGFSYEEAEQVRRGIGKKDRHILQMCISKLTDSCKNKGWHNTQIELLKNQILASANYSFNKSHAISYAYVAYACMYLKEYYPLDWWLGVLNNSEKDELPKFWNYIKDFVLLPDINKSSTEFTIVDDKILLPLSIVKGIGEKIYTQLISHVPYKNLKHFTEIHFAEHTPMNSGITHKLIAAGILDSLYPDKNISVDLKIYEFEKLKAEIKNTKIQPVPDAYIGITKLGEYLLKKQLINIYSDDLTSIILNNRKAKKHKNFWEYKNIKIITYEELQKIKNTNSIKFLPYNIKIGIIGYVVDEYNLIYHNQEKNATKLIVDNNGIYFEEILWPAKDETCAIKNIKKMPILLIYKANQNAEKFYLSDYELLISPENKDKYNIN